MTRKSSAWWAARQADLIRLVAQKMQAEQIAQELGTTRNAVIGRCNRTGVKLCGPTPLWTNSEAILIGAAKRSAMISASPFFVCGHPRTKENTVRTTLKKNKCGSYKTTCRICRNARAKRNRRERIAA